MNPRNENDLRKEVREITDRMIDRIATEEDIRRLSDLVLSHAAARDEYLDRAELHGCLALQGRSELPYEFTAESADVAAEESQDLQRSTSPGSLGGSAGFLVGDDSDDSPSGASDAKSPQSGLVEQTHLAIRRIASPTLAASIAIGLATLVGLVLATFPFGANEVPPVASTDNSNLDPQPLGAKVAQVSLVSADCRWTEESVGLSPGSQLLAGRQIQIESGLAQIDFDCGARILLQSPAILKVRSDTSVDLISGSLVARIEKSAIGFSVLTPMTSIVDLGTEFGVRVGESEETDVRVFEGLVRIEQPMESDWLEEGQLLRKGQSCKIVRGATGQLIAKNQSNRPNSFVRAMPRQHNLVDGHAEEYARKIMALDPVAYYRMEPVSDLVLFDSSVTESHGRVIHTEPSDAVWTPGQIGNALTLRGADHGDHAIVPTYPRADQDVLSVTALVYANSHEKWGSIAKNWGSVRRGYPIEPENRGQFHFGLSEDSGDISIHIAQSNGTQVLAREGKDKPLPLNQWHHVAFAMNGTEVVLYRNGKELARSPCQGIYQKSKIAGLGIGAKLGHYGLTLSQVSPQLWNGQLDEIAIFNRSLSPEEIRSLYESSLRQSR